jgi:hypothetical protein
LCGAILALCGAYLGWHHHAYRQGYDAAEAHYKPIVVQRDGVIADQNAAALKAKAEAASLTATLQALAKQLGDDRAKAKADLDTYRRTHPINPVFLCDRPAESSGSGPVPSSGAAQPASTEASGVLQPAPARNLAPELDEFAADADTTNEAVRVSQP